MNRLKLLCNTTITHEHRYRTDMNYKINGNGISVNNVNKTRAGKT